MKEHRKWLWLVGLLPSALLWAQDDVPDEEVLELSPFVVDAEADVGYYASQTLAGSRIAADVRDLATSISIVTPDFLTDTNATDIADVLIFQGNTEVSGLTGNFSGSQGATPGDPIGELARDNNSGGVTRLRGLAAADLTREFFNTLIPFDSYNSGRIEINRGANAALFGIGSPAGIVNNTLLKAQLEGNFGDARLRLDQYGSFRAEGRYNLEAIDDILAVRIALLRDDEEFQQKEAYNHDERIYLSSTIQPFEDKTFTIRVSGEWGERDAAMPRMMPPGDLISHYYGLRDNGGLPSFNSPLEVGQYWTGTDAVYPGLGVRNNLWVQVLGGAVGPTVFWLDPNSGVPDPVATRTIQYQNELADPTPFASNHRIMFSLRTYNDSLARTGYYPDTGQPIPVPGSGSLWDTRTGRQITDRSIFDYREHLLDGGISEQFARFETYLIDLEKTFLDGRIGLNYAYYWENFREGQLNILRGDPGGESIMIDLNPFLGAEEPNLGRPLRPNPNYGQIAVASRAENGISRSERDSHRITAFAQLRADDLFDEDSMMSRILGHIDFTGVYQLRESEGYQIFTRDTTSPWNVYDQLLGDDPKQNFHVWTFGLGQYHALDYNGRESGVRPIDFSSADQLRGLNIQPINGSQRMPDQITMTMLNLTTQSFQEVLVDLYQATDNGGFPSAFFGSKSINEIESQVINGTWFLLDDNVVFQYAWRDDTQKSGSIGAPGLNADDGFTNGTPGREDLRDPEFVAGPRLDPDEISGEVTNWGVVVHTPDFIEKHLPAGLSLSVHYGEGENFEPTGTRRDIFNRIIPSVTGSTEEYGFTISAMDNKFLARVNFFETGVINGSIDGGAWSAPEGILINLARQLDNPANISQGFTAADSQAVLPEQGVIDVQGVRFDWATPANTDSDPDPSRQGSQDFIAEGMEIELLWNVTPNWTNLVKISRQETTLDNTAPYLRQWYDDFVEANWINSAFAQNFFIDDGGTETLAERTIRTIRDPLLQVEAQDGSPTTEQREWSLILTSKYRFDELFRDWGFDSVEVGGTYRFQDEVGVGFLPTVDEFGRVIQDINSPIMGPEHHFFDIFLSADRQVMGLDTTFQLYVSDVTNHDGLVPVHGNPDGTFTYRILEGRVVSLSATVRF